MKKKILFFLCLMTTVCSAKDNGREETFIREFYANYFEISNLKVSDNLTRNDINMAEKNFREKYYTQNLMQYHNAYYACDEKGELIGGCDCSLLTGAQDEGGFEKGTILIEKKEPYWYTATIVANNQGHTYGCMCMRLKIVPYANTFKVDSVMPNINLSETPVSIYKASRLDKKPMFIGGMEALNKYMETASLNTEWVISYDTNVSPTVTFVVNQNGWTRRIVVKKGLSGIEEFDVYRLIMNMPRWQPGVKDGENVASVVSLTLKKISK